MAETPSWSKCNEALWGFRDYLKEQQFETGLSEASPKRTLSP